MKYLFNIVKIDGATTWWMSNFYEKVCKLYKWDFNDLKTINNDSKRIFTK